MDRDNVRYLRDYYYRKGEYIENVIEQNTKNSNALEEAILRNDENAKRLQRERTKANVCVLKSYRIKSC